MSLVEAVWQLSDLERELAKAHQLRSALQRELLPEIGLAHGLFHVTAERRTAAQALAARLGYALVAAAGHLGKIERELGELHALR